MKDMPGQLCRKLRQSQPEKSGQVGQAFLQQLPLKLSGSERDNYSQLGKNCMTATSRQLVGKLAMTVLKMRPKLGHISRMSLSRSRDRISRQVVGNYYEEGRGQKLGQVGPTFLLQLPPKLGGSERDNSFHNRTNFLGGNFVPTWDEVEKSRQVGESFDVGGAVDLWPSWPQFPMVHL